MTSVWRHLARVTALVVVLAWTVGALGSPDAWQVVVSRSGGAGKIVAVGSLVRHPDSVAVRVMVPRPQTISLLVVMSCRKGLKTRVGGGRVSVRAPSTKTLPLPLSGADHCAVSASGSNPSGKLTLQLLRSR